VSDGVWGAQPPAMTNFSDIPSFLPVREIFWAIGDLCHVRFSLSSNRRVREMRAVKSGMGRWSWGGIRPGPYELAIRLSRKTGDKLKLFWRVCVALHDKRLQKTG